VLSSEAQRVLDQLDEVEEKLDQKLREEFNAKFSQTMIEEPVSHWLESRTLKSGDESPPG
jgi:hypothetical protein